jgi:hypothetical protein
MILDLTGVHQMNQRDQEDWVELRWDDLCKELGVPFGDTFSVKPFDPDHNHRIGFCDPDYGCCDDSLDALKLAVGVRLAA